MRVLFFVITLFILTSCGGGSDNNVTQPSLNCTVSTTNALPGDPGSIDLKIVELVGDPGSRIPMKGVVVQLDHDGVCVTSNAEGFVSFNAISNGEHDVHIFSPEGYGWISLYHYNPAQFRTIFLKKLNKVAATPVKSYVSLKGAVSNIAAGNKYTLVFITDTGLKYFGQRLDSTLNTTSSYAVDFEFLLPVGSSVKGNLVAYEFKNSFNLDEYTLVDTSIISTTAITFTTKATTGNYTSDNNVYDVSFSVIGAKPVESTVLSINDIIVPDRLRVINLNLSDFNTSGNVSPLKPSFVLNNFYSFTSSLVFPRIFKSINPFNFTDVNLYILAAESDKFEGLWIYSKQYAKNTPAFTITPEIKNLPVIQDNQTGNLISWDKVSPNLTSQYLWIQYVDDNSELRTPWAIDLGPKARSIRLPKIPLGITSVLSSSKKYKVKLSGELGNESFIVVNKTWTP